MRLRCFRVSNTTLRSKIRQQPKVNNQTKRVNDKSRICLRNESDKLFGYGTSFQFDVNVGVSVVLRCFCHQKHPCTECMKKKDLKGFAPSPYPSSTRGEGTTASLPALRFDKSMQYYSFYCKIITGRKYALQTDFFSNRKRRL